MSTPKIYTISVQFGHLVRLHELTAYLAGVFASAMQSRAVLQQAPDIIAGLKVARGAISDGMIELLLELIRQGVPSPTSTPRPPDSLVLHLPLPEPLLQHVGQVATATAESYRNFQQIIPRSVPRPVQALLDRYQKDAAEVAGYWLAALADAGVPDKPTA